MNLESIFVIGTGVLIIILAILHEWFGYHAYIKGRTLNLFDKWTPTTPKQMTLLGVFFMISFPWIMIEVINVILILTSNPLGIWLGVVNIIFKLSQLFLLFIYVSWNRIAKLTFALNIIIWVVWISLSIR